MKVGFEVVEGKIAEGGVASLRVVIGEVVTDFQARLTQVAEAAAVEQFGFSRLQNDSAWALS